jgi:hypothetical protein
MGDGCFGAEDKFCLVVTPFCFWELSQC